MNFDKLPDERPNAFPVIPDGLCLAEVEAASVKVSTGEKTSGQTYLAVTYKCSTFDKSTQVKIWDNFYDSDKSLLKYKMRQFLIAINCQLKGDFEFKDLVKIIIGKKFILATKVEQRAGFAARNVVDVFEDSIFYPMSALAELVGTPAVPETTFAEDDDEDDDDAPFDATDGGPATDAEEPDY